MGARGKAIRAFFTSKDASGTTLGQRIVSTAVGVGAVAVVSAGVTGLVTAAVMIPACMSGQCTAALPSSLNLQSPAGPNNTAGGPTSSR